MTFEELTQNFTKEDYHALQKLAANADFQHLRRIVENFQLQRAHNLIAGDEVYKGSSHDELYSYRGGYIIWKKAVDLVESAADKLAELEKNNDKK